MQKYPNYYCMVKHTGIVVQKYTFSKACSKHCENSGVKRYAAYVHEAQMQIIYNVVYIYEYVILPQYSSMVLLYYSTWYNPLATL